MLATTRSLVVFMEWLPAEQALGQLEMCVITAISDP